MSIDKDRVDRAIDRLEKSINYLKGKVDRDAEYQDLIDTLNDIKQEFKDERKITLSVISPGVNLGKSFKAKIEANSKLRSPYAVEVIHPVKDILKVVNNSGLICLIYNTSQNILPSHRQIITFAKEQNKIVIVLVKQRDNRNFASLSDWLKTQNISGCADNILLLLNNFINLNCDRQVNKVRQFLIERQDEIRSSYIRQKTLEANNNITVFFRKIKADNWRNIKQIQEKKLEGKAVHQYQQYIKQKFNLIIQQFRQSIVPIKQSINHSRSNYLNPFLPDSWLFELQQLIEAAKVKALVESGVSYLYLVIDRNGNTEYLHGYILGFYQQKALAVLDSQWSIVNYDRNDGGLAEIVEVANKELAAIPLLDDLFSKLHQIKFNSQTSPDFQLMEIVDFDCLKHNSRIIFDYKYTQSSWFKLSILLLVGTVVYLVSKFYFQKGIYIGFIILVFQLINILTGQNIKTLKLKQHQKELQRTINQKYQTLVRLIIERLIQILIVNLDRQEKQYVEQIKAIASLAELEIEKIGNELDRYKAKGERFRKDEEQILSWLDINRTQ